MAKAFGSSNFNSVTYRVLLLLLLFLLLTQTNASKKTMKVVVWGAMVRSRSTLFEHQHAGSRRKSTLSSHLQHGRHAPTEQLKLKPEQIVSKHRGWNKDPTLLAAEAQELHEGACPLHSVPSVRRKPCQTSLRLCPQSLARVWGCHNEPWCPSPHRTADNQAEKQLLESQHKQWLQPLTVPSYVQWPATRCSENIHQEKMVHVTHRGGPRVTGTELPAFSIPQKSLFRARTPPRLTHSRPFQQLLAH